jgi:FkbM family methyltransferase
MPALKFHYGIPEKNTDITTIVLKQYVVDGHVLIPSDDNVRSRLFGDPLFGTKKVIFVSGLSDTRQQFDDTVDICINTETNEIVTDRSVLRKYKYKVFTNKHEKLRALHGYLKLDFGSFHEEYPEQCMAIQFLKGDEKVLEIGGNIGRNTLVIASILNNSSNLVSLECSDKSAQQLRHNRDLNGFNFHVEQAALSDVKLMQKGWNTVPYDASLTGYTEVKTITYGELMDKYKIQFDTLVLDCEGAFYTILNQFPDILNTVNMIIVENDYRVKEQKTFVDTTLTGKGFRRTYVEIGSEEAFSLRMPCANEFYEVWQRATMIVDIPLKDNFMKKYPFVYLFRYDAYSHIDTFFRENIDVLDCAVKIINEPTPLLHMFDSNYQVLVTYGPTNFSEYNTDVMAHITERMQRRWLHMNTITDAKAFSQSVNYCYISDTIREDRSVTRPVFSIFTTCYNSYDKINRAYDSVKKQKLRDWEWVIVDDSPDDAHFAFLKKKFSNEPKVRLYKRSENSGNIGNVKNEAVSLCRGAYVLEFDHDDEILPDTLADATRVFKENPDVGFVYMDATNIYENGSNFHYGDFICLGYGGYYCQKYNGRWIYVYITPNINNVTLSHHVCYPNHPRIWRRDVLYKLGNYSEFLPICDDFEILLRTVINTKIIKIPKLSYIQYMNDNNNNFSLIRNKEINRISPGYLIHMFNEKYRIKDFMKERDAYDDEKYIKSCKQVWLRTDFIPKYCNKSIQYDYDRQYCIVGVTSLYKHMDQIREAYKNPRNDFFVIDSSVGSNDALWTILDSQQFGRMKCYFLKDTTTDQMKKYFTYLNKTCDEVIMLT